MNPIEASSNICNTQIANALRLSGTTTTETFPPIYGSGISDNSLSQLKHPVKSDNLPLSSLRKRSRESTTVNPLFSYYPPIQAPWKSCNPFSFLGHDMSLQIQQQQFDVDHLVSQHMEKVRMEIEERRKRQARRILEAIEEAVTRKLKAREEEIEKIGKLNWALEERVRSLYIENQIWRELAQTNEATANALRTNLEQVLAEAAAGQGNEGRTPGRGLEEEVVDDAESCWEDNGNININNCVVDNGGGETGSRAGGGGGRLCRNCSKGESCVLLLPCRHLCLCTACGSCLHTCPVCKSPKTVSVHLNMC